MCHCERERREMKSFKGHRLMFSSTNFQGVDVEEEFAALANKDIAQLCAENIMLWQKFLDAFTLKEPIHQHLSKLHHQLRVS